MTDDLDTRIRQQAVPYGLILGLILLVTSIAAFYLMISVTSFLVITFTPFLLSVLLPVVVAIVCCFTLRKKIGGFWTFRQAATGIFIMFVIAYLMQFLGRDMLFAKVIEPNMIDKTQTAMLKATDMLLKKSHTDQTIIDQKEEQISKQFEAAKKTSVVTVLGGVAISVLLVFVVSLVFAALYKKDPPLFNPELQPVKEE